MMDDIDYEFDKQSGDKHFKRVISILSKNNIPYWVDQGTLLGIIRDKKIIPWEWDLDFGVFENEISRKKLENAFLENGFTIENESNKDNYIHFQFENERKVDITFYKKKNNFALTYFEGPHGFYGRFIKHFFSVLKNKKISTKNSTKIKSLLFYFIDFILLIPTYNKHTSSLFLSIVKKRMDSLGPASLRSYKIPLSFINDINYIQFLGIKINIPSKPVKYLEYAYGETWNVPIKNYTWFNEKTQAYL